MFDVIVNSPGCTEEKRVDGWNGLLDLMLLADAADLDRPIVFIARGDSSELLAIVEIESRHDGDSYATFLRCADVAGFAEKCKFAGFEVYIVGSYYYG